MLSSGQKLDNYAGRTVPARAGVIPYTIKDRRLHFLLGIDRRTRELTDFGGGVKSTETMVDGGLREFTEETCMMFGSSVAKNHLLHSPVITNVARNAAIFFLRINPMWLDVAEATFKGCQKDLGDIKKHNELIGVKWVIDQDFKLIAFNKRSQCLWKRIQNILRWNTTWGELYLVLILRTELPNVTTNSWPRLTRKDLKGPTTQIITVS